MKAGGLLMKTPKAYRPLTVAGAALVRWVFIDRTLQLPVELRRVNHTASTNTVDFSRLVPINTDNCGPPYCAMAKISPRIKYLHTSPMADSSHIEQITERVERLLVRYEELTRTNALLSAEVQALSHERDSLKSRLSAARSRVDALLERLPDAVQQGAGHPEAA
jgi:FtsZ-binding cell division protein ZapB